MDKQEARQLTEEEKGLCRELWEEIFTEDSAGFLDYYDNYKAPENRCYGIFEDGRLVSMLELNPYRVSVHGHQAESRYIIAVATRPECRRRGLMGRLLKKSLEEMREAELPFLYLMPAAAAIYYPFGFRYFYEMNTGSLRLRSSEAAGEGLLHAAEVRPDTEKQSAGGRTFGAGDKLYSVRFAKEADIPALVEFSEQVLSGRFDFYTVRDIHYYGTLLAELESEGGGLLLAEEETALKGLVPFWGEEPEIREVLCRPEDGMAVLSAVSAYFSDREKDMMVKAAEVAGPGERGAGTEAQTFAEKEQGDEAGDRIPVAGAAFPMEGKKPVIMGRLCHAERFLELFSADRPAEIRLHLTDGLVEENSGDYLWRLSPEGSRVQKIDGGTGRPEPAGGMGQSDGIVQTAVSCTAAELFSWLAGGRSEDFPEEVRVCRAPFINEIV